jgi:hypothetical protein
MAVEATNQGRDPWRSPEIRLGVRMIGPLDSIPPNPIALFLDRKTLVTDCARADIVDQKVEPGETRVFELEFEPDEEPGLYLVQVDMLKENIHWFSEMGWPGLVWSLEIVRHDQGSQG